MPIATQTEEQVNPFREDGTDRDTVISHLPAEEEISLLDLLIVVAGRRALIAKLTICMAMLGAIVSLLMPSKYTATTTILPPGQNSSSGAGMLSQLGSLGTMASLAGAGGLSLKNPNDLQVALMKSRTVEDAMLDRFHLQQLYKSSRRSAARKKLEKMVEIDSGAKDGLIRLSMTDSDPARAADLANGYIDEFRKSTATLAVTEAAQRRLFFEQQLAQAKDNLASAEEDLKKTEQKTGLIQLDSQARAVIESVAQLKAQIAAKEVQIRGMRSFATDENPDLQMAEQELAGLKAQQEKMGAAGGGDSGVLIPKGVLQQSGLEYVRKLRDVKYYETIFDLLARQYEAAKVDEARQGAVVQVVDRAIVPDTRSSPKRTLITLGAAAFGLFCGILWAFGSEGYARLRNHPVESARLDALKQAMIAGKSNG